MIHLLTALAFSFVLIDAQNEHMAIQTLCMFEARAKGIDMNTQSGWEKVEACIAETECFLVDDELWECKTIDGI